MPKETWTAEQDDQLRTLWAEGLSESKIGERLRCSKHSIHSRARRIGLPTRASPIKREHKLKPPLPRAGAVTLPPLASLSSG